MSDLNKCPICGKEGIPNFRKEDVVCPCCNSNLSVYHQIEELLNQEKPKNQVKYKGLSMLFALVAIILACICAWLLPLNNADHRLAEAADLKNRIACLEDSIKTLNLTIAQKEQSLESISKEKENNSQDEIYIVRKGDSFCKISNNVFGTESRYKDIVKLNNLNVSTTLHIGDTLKIPAK